MNHFSKLFCKKAMPRILTTSLLLTSLLTTLPISSMAQEVVPENSIENPESLLNSPHYVIPPDTIAPIPDATHFGAVNSADKATLNQIITNISTTGILHGQQLVFNSDANFFGDSAVHFYFDDSMVVLCWQEVIDNSVLTFSEIKIEDPSQFRRKLVGDVYGGGLDFCSNLSRETNAVVAMNADFYSFRSLGINCYNQALYRTNQQVDTLFIDGNGDFILHPRGLNTPTEQLQQMITEKNIQFSLAFGPTLIQDGQLVCPDSYPIGEITDCYARACICQVDTLHYLYANVSKYNGKSVTTLKTFANQVQTKGVKCAYTLDGGQTSELIFNNSILHPIVFGKERTVSDMIYFASAIPSN